jgi:hypothetical protein
LIAEDLYVGVNRLSDPAFGHELLDASDHRIEVAVVGDSEPHKRLIADPHHALALGQVHRHRLFAQHMLSRIRRSNCQRGVQIGWRGDVHGFHLRIDH